MRPAARWAAWWRGRLAERGARDRALQLSSAIAVAAAVVVAVLLNVLGARHYRRWDWTSAGLYTLSPATVQTLHALRAPVEIHVLTGATDPLTLSLRHLLGAYGGESTELRVEFVDPDRHAAEFLAIEQRYGIVAGKTEDGQVVTDASVVVASGARHHFITSGDLLRIEDPAEAAAQPRLEQALTGAIRQVVSGTTPRVCFTRGHGEDSISDMGPQGLGTLADRLAKSNYETAELERARELKAGDPIAGCKVVVVAGPKVALATEDVTRLHGYLANGGNLLVAFGPVVDLAAERVVDVGLGSVLALGSIEHTGDFVFERDPAARVSQGFGEAFLAQPKPHAITAGLLEPGQPSSAVLLQLASSLTTLRGQEVAPMALLESSERSFGMVDFFGWAREPRVPAPTKADHAGPLTLAYAAELPKRDATKPHGPRLVVVGASNLLEGASWQVEELRGNALFVESAISWLGSEPLVLDIPDKPRRQLGLRLTEDAVGSVLRYTMLYVPLGVVLLGLGVGLRRRATEGRSRKRASRGAKP